MIGANAIHSLCIANSKESVELALQLCKADPIAATVAWGSGPFQGENCLHVLAVGRREKAFQQVLDITAEHVLAGRLDANMRRRMLRSQATGAFFRGHPMELYGGSPLSFAACYGLEQAVLQMATVDGCDPDSDEWKSEWTGFLPLHAVVATGNVRMYAFLTDPGKLRTRAATPMSLTSAGRGNKWKANMLPVQLTAILGNRIMFELIMRKRLKVVWEWGPACMYEISLRGIDSSGEGGNDVLEIICEPDVKQETAEFLLDDVFFGLMHKIVMDKWALFGRRVPRHNAAL